MKSLIAAALAGATAVLFLDQPLWSRLLAALAVAIGTFLFYGLYILLENIVAAPKRLRRRVPTANGPILILGPDFMQLQAQTIVKLIDEYCWNRERGKPEQPIELKQIWGKIESLGKHLEYIEHHSWRSRRRAKKLYEQISASQNLGQIRLLCLRYSRLKPYR